MMINSMEPAPTIQTGNVSTAVHQHHHQHYHQHRRHRPRLWLVGLVVYCLVHNFRSFSLDHQAWLKSSNNDEWVVGGGGAANFPSKSHLTTDDMNSNYYNNVTWTTPSTTTTTTTTNSTTVAACLLVMDDNHLLVEWLAYHYHVVNLRTLVIATDPKSETSPSSILNRWKKPSIMDGDYHGQNDNMAIQIDMSMTIIEWKEDRDYMTADEFANAQKETRQFYKPKEATTAKEEDGALSPELTKHRARQRLFYVKCLQTLKTMNREEYVLLLDTDEFLNINVNHHINANAAGTAVTLERPGTVIGLLNDEVPSDDDDDNLTRMEVPLQRRPLVHAPLQASPCLQVPRLRFAAQESSEEDVVRRTPSQLWTTPRSGNVTTRTDDDDSSRVLEARDLTTLRYRWHARPSDRKQNRLSKVILHLKRIPTDMLFHRKFMTSIHAPLEAPWCTKQGLHLTVDESVLVIHHYLGSYEQYIYRGAKDARASAAADAAEASAQPPNRSTATMTSTRHRQAAITATAGSENARTPEQFDAIGREMKRPLLASDSIRSWLHGLWI